MSDERKIQEVLARYVRATDRRDGKTQGALFTDDASDHIIEADGDRAHVNAQFVVFEVRAAARPADGWPEGAFGAQGTVRPIESGYYDTDLHRVDGEWKIIGHRVLMDMPYAIPGA
jgi:SnoaL-like domain